MAKEDAQGKGLMLFLSYFGIFSLIPYFAESGDRYVRHHASNGISIIIGSVIGIIVIVLCGCLSGVAVGAIQNNIVSLLVTVVMGLLYLAYVVAILGLTIMGWVKAFGGVEWEVPGLSSIARKLR